MIPPERLIELADELSGKMTDYLTLKQCVDRWERGRHTAHGTAMLELRRLGTKQPMDLLKASAFASEEYRDYLMRWNEAEKPYIAIQSEVEGLKIRIQALQSYFKIKGIEMGCLG